MWVPLQELVLAMQIMCVYCICMNKAMAKMYLQIDFHLYNTVWKWWLPHQDNSNCGRDIKYSLPPRVRPLFTLHCSMWETCKQHKSVQCVYKYILIQVLVWKLFFLSVKMYGCVFLKHLHTSVFCLLWRIKTAKIKKWMTWDTLINT